MNKFILEIGIEEVPSLYIDKALKDIKNMAISELKLLRIHFGLIQSYGTPRRFIVYIEDIHSKQEDISQKIKGPSKFISFDQDGNPKNPAIKFAQMNHLSINELKIEKTDKGEYLFAKKRIQGEKTESLLPAFCLKLITSLSFPKTMRWGKNSFRFIRPIRWLLALYNDQVIPFQLEELSSGSVSYGHRLLSPWPINIASVDQYFELMKKHSIVIDPYMRRQMIVDEMNRLIKEVHGEQNIDQKLLDEVKNLVEYPNVLLGKFHEDYLKLPAEVLKSVMIKHQKYFPAQSLEKDLLPLFFCVINGKEDKHKDTIIRGNERVLKARLEDARFFYQEDQKVSKTNQKPLDWNLKKLKSVVYQENFGSLYDKVKRLILLTEKIGTVLKVDKKELDLLKRSAEICKSDLVSEMVKEFPELQGVMGKEYALLQGEDNHVATAIFEHYLPRFSGDSLPGTLIGSILSIADKLDNITACFLNELIPDGSQDPYALRRQALGIINIILEKNFDLPMKGIIKINIELLSKNKITEENFEIDIENLINIIWNFILQRFKNILLEMNYRYDVVEAVFEKNHDKITEILSRVKLIQEVFSTKEFMKIITAATRTFNLSKNTDLEKVDDSIFCEDEEKELYKKYLKVRERVERAIFLNQYREALDIMETLTEPVNHFFDHVLVMDKDILIRNNRLALLKAITKMYHSIADLSKIALAKGNFK